MLKNLLPEGDTEMPDSVDWAEELPPDCPPTDALEPDNKAYYRLVDTIPPTEKDFWSLRKLFPDRKFGRKTCVASACSVWPTPEDCVRISKLPTQKDRQVVKLILPPASGRIKKTGRGLTHFSWWRTRDFDPIAASSLVEGLA